MDSTDLRTSGSVCVCSRFCCVGPCGFVIVCVLMRFWPFACVRCGMVMLVGRIAVVFYVAGSFVFKSACPSPPFCVVQLVLIMNRIGIRVCLRKAKLVPRTVRIRL